MGVSTHIGKHFRLVSWTQVCAITICSVAEGRLQESHWHNTLASTDHARPLLPSIQAPQHVNSKWIANYFSLISSSKKHCQKSFLVKVVKENKSLSSKIPWISKEPTEKKEPIIQYSKRSAQRSEICWHILNYIYLWVDVQNHICWTLSLATLTTQLQNLYTLQSGSPAWKKWSLERSLFLIKQTWNY